jgi:hypothetical protein
MKFYFAYATSKMPVILSLVMKLHFMLGKNTESRCDEVLKKCGSNVEGVYMGFI